MERRDRAISTLGESWGELLYKEFSKPYIAGIGKAVARLRKVIKVYPAKEDVFRAYKLTPYRDIRVCIVGQDPYYKGQADGLAFSSKKKAIPASLHSIFTEIKEDCKVPVKANPDLTRWATQGVFLLNMTLTVTANQPNSHRGMGWSRFTGRTLEALSLSPVPTVFMLWGSEAKQMRLHINEENHLVLEASHPSPRSAEKGFFGCRHFSKADEFLKKHNLNTIDWT
jgi:uracil-DNA glycosylase